jgi:hypothetical protein
MNQKQYQWLIIGAFVAVFFLGAFSGRSSVQPPIDQIFTGEVQTFRGYQGDIFSMETINPDGLCETLIGLPNPDINPKADFFICRASNVIIHPQGGNTGALYTIDETCKCYGMKNNWLKNTMG